MHEYFIKIKPDPIDGYCFAKIMINYSQPPVIQTCLLDGLSYRKNVNLAFKPFPFRFLNKSLKSIDKNQSFSEPPQSPISERANCTVYLLILDATIATYCWIFSQNLRLSHPGFIETIFSQNLLFYRIFISLSFLSIHLIKMLVFKVEVGRVTL